MDVESIKTTGGYLVATLLTIAGLSTIANPILRSKNFGVLARSNDRAMLAILRAMGARDLSLGMTIGAFMLRGDRKSAGLTMLIAVVTPVADAWVVWNYNGRLKEVWGHLFGASFVGALGWWLSA